MFEADGSVAETETLVRRADPAGRLSARQQLSVGAGTPRHAPTASTRFKDWLTANPQLNVSVRRETDTTRRSRQTLTTLIQTIGFAIAALMADRRGLRRDSDDVHGRGDAVA